MSFVLAYLADNYSLCFHAALQHFDPTRCSLQRLRIRLVVRVVMSPSNNDLVVPKCTSPPSGQKLVGWGKYGLQFCGAAEWRGDTGGKPDVDYVRYAIL